MDSIFVQLALVLGLASLFGFLTKWTKLPLLVAYLLVGITIASLTYFNFQSSKVAILPEIGTAFVLFLIGMELDLREIKFLKRPILTCCLIQILISALAGYTLAYFFGFRGIEAKYLGVGLSFSSTVVIVKLLLEKQDLTSLYGKLSVGILLLEDLVALVMLMFLSASGNSLSFPFDDSWLVVSFFTKGVLLILLAYLSAKFILNKVFKLVADSPELLFLTSLSWCFVFISLALGLGFSVVIGAFLSGVALASSPYHFHISSRLKSLRDFFIVLFFVYLGAQVGLNKALDNLQLILIFVLYALVVKPLIFMLLLGSFGFRKHTIFQTSINLSQISEFSLIILLFGFRLHLISQNALSVMALTVTLSIVLSSILISNSKKVYPLILPFLSLFEEKRFNLLEKRLETPLEDHVVVVGAGRVGGPVVEFLKKHSIPFIVLDFNPQVVEKLIKEDIVAIYGDMGDSEVLDNLGLERAKLVISTSNTLDDNNNLLSQLKRKHSPAKVVVRTQDGEEVEELKKRGADYVLLPESVSADFLVAQLKRNWPDIHFKF